MVSSIKATAVVNADVLGGRRYANGLWLCSRRCSRFSSGRLVGIVPGDAADAEDDSPDAFLRPERKPHGRKND